MLDDARRDFYRARAYYDQEAPHQTDRFVDEFFATAGRLSEFPHSSPELHDGARRANLHIFPYELWYRVHNEAGIVEILALLHHRQDPDGFADGLGLPQHG
ncbi:MAG: type II toxin-antitoxin system RelE/ParE family toxin [Bifidobacteriaceae bacterium]|nr:type II toxin-antitoxin system RelE/ParE family toxin [Bifidobacteriaceae bacterium]